MRELYVIQQFLYSLRPMIIVYGFMGYLNHVDLPMPHVHVLKKHPYCLLCT